MSVEADPGVRLRGVTHDYGRGPVLRDASLSIAAGEIVCLFGPSGCGKTTLLRLIAGFETLQAGTIAIGGDIVAGPDQASPPERRPVGFVFQDFVLFPHLNIQKNVSYGVRERGRARRDRVAAELAAVGLEAMANHYPHELSGGQQQRVAIARAMARDPKALMLDEPFANIDAARRRTLRADMRAVLKRAGVAVALVTHDADDALGLGDRIAMMADGRILEVAAPRDLFERPKTAAGAALFPGSQILSGSIRCGRLATPIGEFAAPDLPDGDGVAVLRSDALEAAASPGGDWSILDQRFAGPGYRVDAVHDSAGVRLSAQAREPIEIGARAAIHFNENAIRCFEASAAEDDA